MNIEELLKQPYYVMDILPMQVPANGGGQYFKVEQYYLNHVERLSCQYADVLLKLYVMLAKDSMLITLQRDTTYMTLYNLTDELLHLLRQLASAVGLFVWSSTN